MYSVYTLYIQVTYFTPIYVQILQMATFVHTRTHTKLFEVEVGRKCVSVQVEKYYIAFLFCML